MRIKLLLTLLIFLTSLTVLSYGFYASPYFTIDLIQYHSIFIFSLWIFSVLITNVSIVDIWWGLGIFLLNLRFFLKKLEIENDGMISMDILPSFTFSNFIQLYLPLLLSLLWSLRLTLYLAWRNIGKGEDFRYQSFRKRFGVNRYWWVSFFQTFLLQGLLQLLLSYPFLLIFLHDKNDKNLENDELFHFKVLLITILFFVGLYFEAMGDFQLSQFRQNKNKKRECLDYGVWKYTRHPNYFGDAVQWWAFFLLSVVLHGFDYTALCSPILMTILLTKISGGALLEKTLKKKERGESYKKYIADTSAFIPLPKGWTLPFPFD